MQMLGLQKNEPSCQARLVRGGFVNDLEFHQDLEERENTLDWKNGVEKIAEDKTWGMFKEQTTYVSKAKRDESEKGKWSHTIRGLNARVRSLVLPRKQEAVFLDSWLSNNIQDRLETEWEADRTS